MLDRAAEVLAGEPEHDRELFLARLRRHWPDLLSGLEAAYGDAAPAAAARAVDVAARRAVERPADLRLLDLRRLVDPDWFQAPSMLGYACYADRFGGTLAGVAERAGYLRELGVTYLHLMPLLAPRPAPNDGGYAVQDYRRVREDLGTMDDLADLAAVLRAQGVSLVLDLVLNHVAREHEWAVRARAGEERYRGYFHVHPDRAVPDAFERTLPEVFPDFAPGSFTWDDDLRGWVWTTFNAWQWDLDWHNPEVFLELADVVCHLANQGVEVLRLDAIAFLWKRLGTDCQNQPEVHALTQALRAVARVQAPALAFKAEAIVGPDDLAHYLGVGRHAGKVSDLAYHNTLMVQVWSSLAARDARLLTTALRRFPPKPPTTAWGTYVRCHDDIGWAVSDEDAAAVGWDGAAHRRFLSDFYSGEFPGSFARGLVFQHNPATGDRRISGTAASLAGLERALDEDDPHAAELAVRRLLLAHHVVLGHGGVPLVWMGDELGLLNDRDWAQDPAHAGDNRWVHRPRMPWDVAERRHREGTVEHRLFHGLRAAVRARAGLPAMHASVEAEALDPPLPGVLMTRRRHPEQTLVCLYNLTEHDQWVPRGLVPLGGALRDELAGQPAGEADGTLLLTPYRALWLTGDAGGEPARDPAGT
ncbi:alpha-amylase [Vallicoccus soli]|uniref:Alpha-amylase n=1 Tax=Vallicoccus soli TaxID=2339232 RepID=A0A3A3YXP8_9ACTN|nr:alpha-amylase [Vallicoccus soli]